MRDDENVWEDVEGNAANGLETITTWGEQADWSRDVLGLPNTGWETCFTSGEVDVMRKVRNAVSAGGVGFFCIDSALISDGGDDDEENAWWRASAHFAGAAPTGFGEKFHSEDDGPPWPNHWVVYLGGMSLSADPADDDPLEFRVWSWGREYKLTCTVDAFSEYLYAGATGTP
jgi:hypothetical protein